MHPFVRTRSGALFQRGSTLMGLVVGLVVGIALVAGLVFWYGKTQSPVVNKIQQKETLSEVDEAAKNKDWNPNIALFDKPVPLSLQTRAASEATSAPSSASSASAEAAIPKPAEVGSGVKSSATKAAVADPIGDLINSKTKAAVVPASSASVKPAEPNQEDGSGVFYVQLGAFKSLEDANTQKAKLAMLGVETKISEREQNGKPVYRVRVGSFKKQEEADSLRTKLEKAGFEAALVKSPR